jgi:hypothetical protein
MDDLGFLLVIFRVMLGQFLAYKKDCILVECCETQLSQDLKALLHSFFPPCCLSNCPERIYLELPGNRSVHPRVIINDHPFPPAILQSWILGGSSHFVSGLILPGPTYPPESTGTKATYQVGQMIKNLGWVPTEGPLGSDDQLHAAPVVDLPERKKRMAGGWFQSMGVPR